MFKRKTKIQATLKSKQQRKENIKDAFICYKNVENKNILIFDDVHTTGATINECKKTLIKAGAKSVTCITLLKA